MQSRVKLLSWSSSGYQKIRHRFFETYQRDVKGKINPDGRKRINAGNIAAHEGDAVADAYLYQSGERSDERLFVEIYGLTPTQVLALGKYYPSIHSLYPHNRLMFYIVNASRFDAIAVLNTTATLHVRDPARMPSEVKSAFENFITVLEPSLAKNWVDKDGGLKKAYEDFWKAYEMKI